MRWIVAIAALAVGWGATSVASAQYLAYSGPVVTYRATPSYTVATPPVVAPTTTVYRAYYPPAVSSPSFYQAYYPPAVSTTVASPVVYQSYYPSIPAAPVVTPQVTYRAYYPSTVYPSTVVGSAVVAPGVVVRPKVYVAGQPIRNVLRAITP